MAKRAKMAIRAKGGFGCMLMRCTGNAYSGGVDDQGGLNVAL